MFVEPMATHWDVRRSCGDPVECSSEQWRPYGMFVGPMATLSDARRAGGDRVEYFIWALAFLWDVRRTDGDPLGC